MKYILPLFFIVFSLGEITRIQFPNAIAINLVEIISVVLVGTWFAKRKEQYLLKKPILLFITVCVASLLVNLLNFEGKQILVGSLYLLRWTLFASLYFVFRDFSKLDKERALKFMTTGGLVFVALGLLQYFFYPALINLYYLGWDEHLMRLFGSFLDPNFSGAFIALFIFFVFTLKDRLPFDIKVSYIVLALSLVALVLTYSRGAFLMLLTGALVYSLINRNFKIIGGLLLSSILIFLILSPKFNMEGTNLLRTASIFQRIESVKEGKEVFLKNPVLGVGFNTFRYAREKYGFEDKSKFGPSHSGAGVENSLVFVLATTGILGLVSYSYLLLSMFKLGVSEIKKNKLGLLLVVSLSGLVVNSLVINSLFYSFLLIWIFVLAGLTENTES